MPKGHQWRRALDLLSEMRLRGQPNVVSYSAAISACEKRGKGQQHAIELTREMRERRITPNVVTFSAAISACGQAGQWANALELFDELKASGQPPNVIT